MSDARPAPTDDRNDRDDRRARLESYLRRQAAAEAGAYYFKSKFVADDLGMSPSEIGTLVNALREEADGITIEKWSYTNATTWRVTVAEREGRVGHE